MQRGRVMRHEVNWNPVHQEFIRVQCDESSWREWSPQSPTFSRHLPHAVQLKTTNNPPNNKNGNSDPHHPHPTRRNTLEPSKNIPRPTRRGGMSINTTRRSRGNGTRPTFCKRTNFSKFCTHRLQWLGQGVQDRRKHQQGNRSLATYHGPEVTGTSLWCVWREVKRGSG